MHLAIHRHGTIGGTSVKLLHNIKYMHYAIAHDQFYATDEEIKKVWTMMKIHFAIVYHIPWWERKARMIKARHAQNATIGIKPI